MTHYHRKRQAHRAYLRALDLQIARQGGDTTARTSLVVQAAETRAAIEQCKLLLRSQGYEVADEPIDAPPLEAPGPAAAAPAPIINITIGDNNHFENSSITLSDIGNTERQQ